MEKHLNQTIEFTDHGFPPTTTDTKTNDIERKEYYVMDQPTEITLLEINKNYSKMMNNMFAVCGRKCIKNFNISIMNTDEKFCVENCQKKFYLNYSIGKKILNEIMKEVKDIDLFSDKTEVDLAKNAKI